MSTFIMHADSSQELITNLKEHIAERAINEKVRLSAAPRVTRKEEQFTKGRISAFNELVSFLEHLGVEPHIRSAVNGEKD
jgi:hypothetical protein